MAKQWAEPIKSNEGVQNNKRWNMEKITHEITPYENMEKKAPEKTYPVRVMSGVKPQPGWDASC